MPADSVMIAAYLDRCREDEVKFYANELYIRDKKRRIVRFDPWEPQIRLIKNHQKARAAKKQWKLILVKARQWGGSTTIDASLVVDAVLWGGVSGAVISHDKPSAAHLAGDILVPMLRRLDPAFRRELIRGSTQAKFLLSDGSEINVFTANNRSAGQSYTLTHLHCSEVARWRKGFRSESQADDVLGGLLNAVPDEHVNPLVTVALESTADGASGIFHDMYWQAKEGELAGYQAWFVGYHEIPDYQLPLSEEEAVLEHRLQQAITGADTNEAGRIATKLRLDENALSYFVAGIPFTALKWRRDVGLAKCGNDEDAFKAHYPSNDKEAFLGAGRPVFSPLVLQGWRETLDQVKGVNGDVARGIGKDKRSRFEANFYGLTTVYKHPAEGYSYIIGCDCSEGTAGQLLEDSDFSVATVLCSNTGEVVAKFRGQPDPSEFGEILDALGSYYNMATLVVEKNGPGTAVLMKLRDLHYNRLYCRKIMDSVTQEWTPIIGFSTDKHSRSVILASLREAVRMNAIKVWDQETISELGTMQINKTGRWDVPKKKHDDCIFALALAVYVSKEEDVVIAEDLESADTGYRVWDGKFRPGREDFEEEGNSWNW